MKLSKELLKNRFVELEKGNKIHNIIIDDYGLDRLDSRFIDKEELYNYIRNFKINLKSLYEESLKDKKFNQRDKDLIYYYHNKILELLESKDNKGEK
jgi:hypothetical protein